MSQLQSINQRYSPTSREEKFKQDLIFYELTMMHDKIYR